MIQFLVGAVVGGLAAWQYRDDIRRYMDQKLPDVRAKAADRLESLEKSADSAIDRARTRRVPRGANRRARGWRRSPRGGRYRVR